MKLYTVNIAVEAFQIDTIQMVVSKGRGDTRYKLKGRASDEYVYVTQEWFEFQHPEVGGYVVKGFIGETTYISEDFFRKRFKRTKTAPIVGTVLKE